MTLLFLRRLFSIFVISVENFKFMKTKRELEQIATEIVDAIFQVHKEIGPGLLESVYELSLLQEFHLRNIKAKSQVSIPLLYKGVKLSKDFKIDILVDEEIIIELKAVEVLLPVHKAQIISYLKLADKRIGFLVNFNVPLIKQGIQRIVNNY